MSTNYYFRNKDTKEKLHIGQTIFHKEPLFQKTAYYATVEEIKEYYQSKQEDVEIIDEYERSLSWKELENRLLNVSGEIRTGYENESGWYRDKQGNLFVENDFC